MQDYSKHEWERVVLLEIATLFSLNGNKTLKSCENVCPKDSSLAECPYA